MSDSVPPLGPRPHSSGRQAPAGSTRRALLQRSVWGAAWVGAPALVQTAWAQAPLAPTPRQTEGPFYPIALPADNDAKARCSTPRARPCGCRAG